MGSSTHATKRKKDGDVLMKAHNLIFFMSSTFNTFINGSFTVKVSRMDVINIHRYKIQFACNQIGPDKNMVYSY